MEKITLPLRIFQIKLTLFHPNLIEQTVLRLRQPLFEGLRAFRLDKFVRVLIWP